MTETKVGREVVQIVEFVQPFCSRTFGVSPCTATGTADEKCFNTRGTCDDPDNFELQSGGLSLFFSKGNVAERGVSGAPYIVPSLVSVSTAPTRINLSAASSDATGLGNRAVCTIRFKDLPHSDRVVDPYLSGRTYNPSKRGSFWTKWLRRNRYRYNLTIRVYEGYAGQALSAMTKRSYILTSVNGPDEAGNVTVQGKDILAKLEERKAQAPEASPGELESDITASDTSLTLLGGTTEKYPATGTLRIGDELIAYTGRTGDANGLDFTGLTRGSDGTTAASHSAGETAQRCLRYTAQNVDDIVTNLLTVWAGIDASYIDTSSFTTERANYLSGYILSTVISEPVAVSTLVSELQEQCGFNIWWDERAELIKMKAVRGVNAEPPLLTEGNHIVGGTFSIADQPRKRISQVWFHYDRRTPVAKLGDVASFKTVKIQADLPSESEEQYGEPSIRQIFSRWISASGLALSTASKIVVRYSVVPRVAKFRLDAKDRGHWVGDQVRIKHKLDIDQFGEHEISTWTIIQAEEVVPGHQVEYLAEDTTLYGKITTILPNSAADYDPATATFTGAYIGDSNGLLSDGTPCARIT